MDSGVSIHAASWKDLFTSYRSSDFGIAKMGNGGLVKVINIGDVYLEMKNGSRLVLKDVKHIIEIYLNLISIRKLDDGGYDSSLTNG